MLVNLLSKMLNLQNVGIPWLPLDKGKMVSLRTNGTEMVCRKYSKSDNFSSRRSRFALIHLIYCRPSTVHSGDGRNVKNYAFVNVFGDELAEIMTPDSWKYYDDDGFSISSFRNPTLSSSEDQVEHFFRHIAAVFSHKNWSCPCPRKHTANKNKQMPVRTTTGTAVDGFLKPWLQYIGYQFDKSKEKSRKSITREYCIFIRRKHAATLNVQYEYLPKQIFGSHASR